jgi:hypothetical protein
MKEINDCWKTSFAIKYLRTRILPFNLRKRHKYLVAAMRASELLDGLVCRPLKEKDT